MSYLNSVLAEIRGEASSPAPPRASIKPKPAPKPTDESSIIVSGSKTTSSKSAASNSKTQGDSEGSKDRSKKESGAINPVKKIIDVRQDLPKRKADSEILEAQKRLKKEIDQPKADKLVVSARPASSSIKSSVKSASLSANNVAKKSTLSTPVKAESLSATPSSSLPPPKKGSYREIKERARMNEASSLSFGLIKHKPTTQLSEKEARSAREVRKAVTRKSRSPQRSRPVSRASSTEPRRGKKPINQNDTASDNPIRKPSNLGYKGTMRPSSSDAAAAATAATKPEYKGTMNLKTGNRSQNQHRAAGGSFGRDRYSGYNGHSEDDVESDGHSQYSSDMEAGAFDLDEEEELTLKVAKSEDAAALREENELKRKKADRKRQLAKLAAETAQRNKRRIF